jgi:hypothetical protein
MASRSRSNADWIADTGYEVPKLCLASVPQCCKSAISALAPGSAQGKVYPRSPRPLYHIF